MPADCSPKIRHANSGEHTAWDPVALGVFPGDRGDVAGHLSDEDLRCYHETESFMKHHRFMILMMTVCFLTLYSGNTTHPNTTMMNMLQEAKM